MRQNALLEALGVQAMIDEEMFNKVKEFLNSCQVTESFYALDGYVYYFDEELLKELKNVFNNRKAP